MFTIPMIDTVSIAADIRPPEKMRNLFIEQSRGKKIVAVPFEYWGLNFSPSYNHNGGLVNYTGKLKNLFLTLSFSQLFIANSWHKYYMHGNNFTDYTSRDVAETFYILNDQLKGSLKNTVVKKIAYGVVIDAEPDFNEWFMFRTKTPLPMANKGIIYGAKIQLNDYSIKAYDKAFEVKRHNGLTISRAYRIEKEVSYMRHLHKRTEPIRIFQASDLTNPEILRQLGKDFITTYQRIEKIKNMDLQGLSAHQVKVIAAMQDKRIREHLRQKNNQTYRRDFKEYKQLLNDIKSGNETEQKIIEKVGILTAT